MPRPQLNTIDDYDDYLTTTLAGWSPAQRTALAAAMAERWLHVYEAFSKAEQWGDPEGLRRSLDAVWNHVGGRRLSPADVARHLAQVRGAAPHMDDFDAPEALAAAVMVDEALSCCGTDDNVVRAVSAALSGFEAVMPDWVLDPDEQPRLWRQSAIRKELAKQLQLVEQIGAVTTLDAEVIAALRRDATSAGTVGVVPARTEPKPAVLTNQAAFEQYRRMIEADIKGAARSMEPGDNSYLRAMLVVAQWAARYRRRRNTINGEYGPLADSIAMRALEARQQALDSRDTEPPAWDAEARTVIDLCLANSLQGLDINAVEQPHRYGPSLRRLWHQAKRGSQSDAEAWQSITAWCLHRPAAWDIADARKKQGIAHEPPLGDRLARAVAWERTADVEYPWSATVDGVHWQVRLNDFPDDYMYTLVIGGDPVGDFHDWPETWARDAA